MNQKTPMKRSAPMARGAGFAKKTPGSEPKLRVRKCALASCRKPFEPRSMTHKCCGPACAEAFAVLERARRDRADRQAGLAKLKTKRDFIKEAQVAFNAYIRARDADQPCICCGRTSEKQYLTGTNWDCGHYRSTGSAPHLRFNEDNAHRQLTICNRHGAGRAVDYRIGLIRRIGIERVEALESMNEVRKWTAEEVQAIKAHYKAKLKALLDERKTTTA